MWNLRTPGVLPGLVFGSLVLLGILTFLTRTETLEPAPSEPLPSPAVLAEIPVTPSEPDIFSDRHLVSINIPEGIDLILHEGLPHHWTEHDLLQSELKEKPTEYLDRFPFYKETLELTQEDAQLLKLWLNSDSLVYFDGTVFKTCSGYHPDYAIEWQNEAGERSILSVCLGCSEAHYLGPDSYPCTDIYDVKINALRQILSKYRKNRPSQKRL